MPSAQIKPVCATDVAVAQKRKWSPVHGGFRTSRTGFPQADRVSTDTPRTQTSTHRNPDGGRAVETEVMALI